VVSVYLDLFKQLLPTENTSFLRHLPQRKPTQRLTDQCVQHNTRRTV